MSERASTKGRDDVLASARIRPEPKKVRLTALLDEAANGGFFMKSYEPARDAVARGLATWIDDADSSGLKLTAAGIAIRNGAKANGRLTEKQREWLQKGLNGSFRTHGNRDATSAEALVRRGLLGTLLGGDFYTTPAGRVAIGEPHPQDLRDLQTGFIAKPDPVPALRTEIEAFDSLIPALRFAETKHNENAWVSSVKFERAMGLYLVSWQP